MTGRSLLKGYWSVNQNNLHSHMQRGAATSSPRSLFSLHCHLPATQKLTRLRGACSLRAITNSPPRRERNHQIEAKRTGFRHKPGTGSFYQHCTGGLHHV